MFASPDLVGQNLKNSNHSLTDNDFEQLFEILERDYEQENLSFYGDVEVAKEYSENEMKQKKQRRSEEFDLNGNLFDDNLCFPQYNPDNIVETVSSDDGDDNNNYNQDNNNWFNNAAVSSSKTSTSNSLKISTSSNPSDITSTSASAAIPATTFITPTIAPPAPTSSRYIVSASNPHYLAYPKERRIDYLRRVPNLMQVAMNSSNLEMMKGIIEEAFSEYVVVKITHMQPFQGRDMLFQHHSSLIRLIPDFHLLFTNIRRNHRIISARQFSFGTGGRRSFMQSTDKYDFLWNCFKNLPTIDVDPGILEQKIKYDQLLAADKSIKFERKATLFLVLNEQLTHIDQLISQKSTIEVFEA